MPVASRGLRVSFGSLGVNSNTFVLLFDVSKVRVFPSRRSRTATNLDSMFFWVNLMGRLPDKVLLHSSFE